MYIKKQRLMQKITHKQVMFVCDFFCPVLWHNALACAKDSRGVLFFLRGL